MTTSIIPQQRPKDQPTARHLDAAKTMSNLPPAVEVILAFVAFLLAPVIDFIEWLTDLIVTAAVLAYLWERAHDRTVKRAAVLTASVFTFGTLFGLHLAGAR